LGIASTKLQCLVTKATGSEKHSYNFYTGHESNLRQHQHFVIPL